MNSILPLFCFFFMMASYQQVEAQELQVVNNLLQLGDSYYSKNLRGFSNLLLDVKQAEPDLYQSLTNEVQVLRNRRTLGIVIMSVGTIGGSALLTSGAVDTAINSDGSGGGRLTSGIVLLTGSLVGGALLLGNQRESLLNLVNTFNRQTIGDKIQLTLHPIFDWQQAPIAGVGLRINF